MHGHGHTYTHTPTADAPCAAEEGILFRATEAREREKEVARLKAEAANAEHVAQQVGAPIQW